MALACLAQCGCGVCSEIGKNVVMSLWGHLKSRVGYLVHYKKKVDKLCKSSEDLMHTKNDMQRSADAAERNGEVVNDVVTAWLQKVDELKDRVDKMVTEVGENKRCLQGCCPDLAWRYKLGKEATERAAEVEELKGKGKFESVSQPSPPQGIESMPARDFMAFSSTRDAMDNVMEAMRNEEKQLIGIYGMGGVGKTTIMEELGRQFTKEKEFGTVVKVYVSQNPNVAQIRREIAEALGMRLWGDGDAAAQKLASRLKKETKVVILLDDIWGRLELREIGIPYGEELKGCKILFTTRTLQACQLMECHAAVLVDVLTQDDSWTLFRSKVGSVADSPDISPVARKVTDECGGLPLAIVVVGRALRGNNKKSVWESALMQLKRSIPDELLNVEEQLFKSLELSYNYIKNVEMKLLFLFCCLFREDYVIGEDELTRYAVGEGFLSNVYTLEEARGKVHLLVDDLIACCLLLSTDKERHVKMHDVVRDVAVYIASKGEDCFFVKAGLGMRDWPESKNLDVCKRISLMNNDIQALPDQPNCPKLLTLLLNINPLSVMTGNFFQGMLLLTVLDLSDTNIDSLPSSLASLTNLGALRLDRCMKLHDISLIGRLKKLKILGLQKCQVNELPEEIGTLVDLKLLDLSYSTSLKIPPNVISKLSRLEELFMIGYDMNEALFVQIGSLKRLVSLQVYISDVRYFSQHVEAIDSWKNIRQFIVYDEIDWYPLATIYKKNLYLKKVSHFANWAKILLTRAEDLILDECNWNLNEGGFFVSLKKFRLANDSRIVSLLDVAQPGVPPNAFAYLEHLTLANLENLKGLCHGQLPTQSFENLLLLDIVRCNKLVTIIPRDLLQRVHCRLEVLTVNLCNGACEVFNSEGFDERVAMLPELKKLSLNSLPNLTKIWNGNVPPGSLQKLSALQVAGARKLEYLFFQQSGQGYRKIFPTGALVNLKELVVVGCPNLKHLLLPSLVHELRSLERLEVKKNPGMEEIVAVEDGAVLDKGAFPRLKELVLIDLPILESFYEQAKLFFDWPLLESVKLELCPSMKWLPVGLNSAPKLTKVNVGDDDDADWFLGLEWEDASIPSRFQICKDQTG